MKSLLQSLTPKKIQLRIYRIKKDFVKKMIIWRITNIVRKVIIKHKALKNTFQINNNQVFHN